MIGPSIQADIVDWDELQSGQRKEGAYAAVWKFIRKAGAAGAAALGGVALTLGGYDPGAEVQSEEVKDAKFKKGAGCKKCGDTGYRGRQGIFEMLIMNNELRDLAQARAPIVPGLEHQQ